MHGFDVFLVLYPLIDIPHIYFQKVKSYLLCKDLAQNSDNVLNPLLHICSLWIFNVIHIYMVYLSLTAAPREARRVGVSNPLLQGGNWDTVRVRELPSNQWWTRTKHWFFSWCVSVLRTDDALSVLAVAFQSLGWRLTEKQLPSWRKLEKLMSSRSWPVYLSLYSSPHLHEYISLYNLSSPVK